MLNHNQGDGSPSPAPAEPIAICDGDGDPYFDVLDFIEPVYRTVGVKRFRIEGITYSWKGIPEGRHLRISMIAADHLWLTSPQMSMSANRLMAWLQEHRDVYVEATAPGMLKALLDSFFHPAPLIDGKWKRVGGYLWPAHDRMAAPLILGEAEMHNLEYAMKGVENFNVCVQAGGNVGVFPVRLSFKFRWVFTFEPVDELRECLFENVKRHERTNVAVSEAALGKEYGTASMTATDGNVGAGQIAEGKDFKVVPLDAFKLEGVGLIWLDCNGTETFVLEGGVETITKNRPVIIVEDGELSARFGIEKFAATKWLEAHNYVRVGVIGPDTKFMPKERV